MTFFRGLTRARRVTLLVVTAVLAGLAAAGGALASGGGGGGDYHITALFTRTIGLYKGNDVRILGIKVGTIDNLTPQGTSVRVDMTVDGKYKLPADVAAVVVPPSVVSDRYIQLTPAYTGGPVLPRHARLGLDRTQVPLEFDEIFRNLDQLNTALGPNGANKHGALSKLIDISAKNLSGNGAALNGALKEFSAAISTLAGSRGNLFATVRQLQQFTTTIARDDSGDRALDSNLAKVGGQLSSERKDLGAALANLATALSQVNSFVADNRSSLTGDIHQLTSVTNVLTREKDAVQEIVDMAPSALTNLALAGDPRAHTLDTKDDAQEPLIDPNSPSGALCQIPVFKSTPLCQAPTSSSAKTWQQLLAVHK
jgi:phospholipid/cholesterol/gamma-HCH transport system substrate-binding protein